jgi:hypothetical protein
MALATSADRLKRYAGMARLFYKYGSRDLVARAGLDDALEMERPTEDRTSAIDPLAKAGR